jgi:hypothetical protein
MQPSWAQLLATQVSSPPPHNCSQGHEGDKVKVALGGNPQSLHPAVDAAAGVLEEAWEEVREGGSSAKSWVGLTLKPHKLQASMPNAVCVTWWLGLI